MAISSPLRAPIEWRVAAAPREPPLATVIPAIDVIALCLSVIVVGHADALGLVFVFLSFAVLLVSGTHRARISPRLGDDMGPLVARLAVAMLLVAPFATRTVDLAHFTRIAPVAVLFVLVGRSVSYRVVRTTRARGRVSEPTLIVGAGALGVKAATTLLEHPEFGLVPVGFLDSFDDVGLPAPILGSVQDLEPVIREFGVRHVIVAFGGVREHEMVPVIRACDRLPVELHVMPRFFELGIANVGPFSDDLWGIPLVRLRRSALRTVAWRTKRVFDLAAGSLCLVITAPLMIGAAVAVRLSGPGPIFFRQRRIGQRGEVFELLKFRTLPLNRDSDTTWNVDSDDRVTPAGKFLRRTSLDELPQLINVLRGEMSLVGPRPERPYFADRFRVAVQGYDDRHRVPAGITGWAQVHGLRGDTSIEERAVFDNHYVENWSLWGDLVILFRTIGTMLRGER